MSHPAYLLITLGLPRDHHSLFIQTSSSGRGYVYQVSGNIQSGMFFNHKPFPPPTEELGFISMTQIGLVKILDFENGKIQEIVETVKAPRKQFDGPKRLFPREPVRRCQEWMADVVGRLQTEGLLEEIADSRGVDE